MLVWRLRLLVGRNADDIFKGTLMTQISMMCTDFFRYYQCKSIKSVSSVLQQKTIVKMRICL